MKISNIAVSTEEKLAALMQNIPGGILDYRVTDHVETVYFSDSAAEMLGYGTEEYERLFSHDPLSAVHPEDRPSLEDSIQKLIDGEIGELDRRYRILCKNGDWLWVRIIGRITKRADGELYASVIRLCVDEEIKKERLAAAQSQELLSRRQFLDSLYNTLSCGIIVCTCDGDNLKLTDFNDAAWRIFGFESRRAYLDEVVHSGIFPGLDSSDADIAKSLISEALLDGKPKEGRLCVRCPDGGERYVKYTVNSSGGMVHFVLNDVTKTRFDHINAYAKSFLTKNNAVFRIDTESSAITAVGSGIDIDEEIGKNYFLPAKIRFFESMPTDEESRREVSALFDFENGDTVPRTVEFRSVRRNGSLCWVRLRLIPLVQSVYVLCFNDITDEREAAHLAEKNRSLTDDLRRQYVKARRSTLLLEVTGYLPFEYYIEKDTIHYLYSDNSGKTVEKTKGNFLRSIGKSECIGAAYRNLIADEFRLACTEKRTSSFEYVGTLLGGGFNKYHIDLASVTDTDGKIYCITGAIRPADKAEKQENKNPEEICLSDDDDSTHVYVIDNDSFEVLYCNSEARASRGTPTDGQTCYAAFFKRDTPCVNCPVVTYQNRGFSYPVTLNHGTKKFIMQASGCSWHGKPAVAVTGTDLSRLTSDNTHGSIPYDTVISQIKPLLSAVSDEAVLVDYASGTYRILDEKRKMHIYPSRRFALDLKNLTECLVCDEDRERVRDYFRLENICRAVTEGGTGKIEFRIVVAEGIRWQRTIVVHAEADKYIFLTSDISNEKRVISMQKYIDGADRLAMQNDAYEKCMRRGGTAVVEWNAKTGESVCSDSFLNYAVSRFDPSDTALDVNILVGLVHPDDEGVIRTMYEQIKSSSAPFNETAVRMRMCDGSIRHTALSVMTETVSDNHARICTVILTDIDELVCCRKSLSEIQRRYSLIENSLPAGIATYQEINGKYVPVYVSDKTCEMFGFTPDEYSIRIANGEAVNFMPDLTQPEIRQAARKNPDGNTRLLTFQAKRQDGSWFWLQFVGRHSTTEDGRSMLYAVLFDVTDIVENRRELDAIMSVIPTGVFRYLADESGKISVLSDRFVSMLGFSRDEIRRRFHGCIYNLIDSDDRYRVEREVMRQRDSGICSPMEYKFITSDGPVKFHCERNIVRDAAGRKWFFVSAMKAQD